MKLIIKLQENIFEMSTDDPMLLLEKVENFLKAYEESWKPKPSAEQIILDFTKRYPALANRLTAKIINEDVVK